MKKLTALLLALAMVLSLCACGGNKTENSPAESTPTQSDTSGADTADTSAEEPEEIADPVPVVESVNVTGEGHAEDGTTVMTYSYDELTVTLDGNEAAEQKIQAYLDDMLADFIGYVEEQTSEAEDMYSGMLAEGNTEDSYRYTFTNNLTASVRRCDADVLSIVTDQIGYAGGAHGWDLRSTANFNVHTGDIITFADLGGDAFVDFCTQNVLEQAELMSQDEDMYFFDDYQDHIYYAIQDGTQTAAEVYGDELYGDGLVEATWYFDNEGIQFISGEYLLQPYAVGIVEFPVSYSELNGVMDAAYFPEGV